jgi:dTDP-glucose pyrophosphorylase
MSERWRQSLVFPEASLGEAVAKVDASGLQVGLVVSHDGTLEGILTDGDIRRAILAGHGLDVPVTTVMNPRPMTAAAGTSDSELLALMRRAVHHHIPLIDELGHVAGLARLDDLIGVSDRENWVVLMAGGRGTRLQPLTQDCPKPMLAVGGRPILETIIESFSEQGFRRIFLSVNYKAEMIVEHFGSGDRWGVKIEYLHEQAPLGTAGALALLPSRPAHPLLVMNADLLTRLSFSSLLQFHAASGAMATMAVRHHQSQLPYGVVQVDGSRLASIEDKPVQRFLINAGIYVLSPGALEFVSSGKALDMPDLYQAIINAGQPAVAYPIREYWLDIGRLEEFERAQSDIRSILLP